MSRLDVLNGRLKRAHEKHKNRLRKPPVGLGSMHRVYECE
jgi:hypothetical protein